MVQIVILIFPRILGLGGCILFWSFSQSLQDLPTYLPLLPFVPKSTTGDTISGSGPATPNSAPGSEFASGQKSRDRGGRHMASQFRHVSLTVIIRIV
jgi:hypothetical protein